MKAVNPGGAEGEEGFFEDFGAEVFIGFALLISLE
jgi:hypothetical protein